MATKVITISMGRMSGNIFLLQIKEGFLLIDTGIKLKRRKILKKLKENNCSPGKLHLIIITHGDFDHTGNAAYLRKIYNTKIAMHADDAGMVEKNNMFWNRTTGNKLMKFLVNTFFGLPKVDRFKPDIMVEDGFKLDKFGLDGKILSIPGHSKGSIGILTADKLLFCGDLFTNWKKPDFSSIMDNLAIAKSSFVKLSKYDIKTIYPGHGEPFSFDLIKHLLK